ncbi:hypothetical protein HRbin36_02220 [bacterium HR36]|nr:hypothetical protein HRbin36_02220 [bacterium HR36]
MGGQEDGSPLASLLQQQILKGTHPIRVKTEGRLIHYQNPRLVQQGSRKGNALFHAVGIGFGQIVQILTQLKEFHQLGNPPAALFPLYAVQVEH